MITTDNASNNDTMMECLERKLGSRDDHYFQSSWCHVRCIPHVVNLVCGDILSGVTRVKRKELDRILDENCNIGNNIGPLDKTAMIIRKIRRSPIQTSRYFAFCESKGLKKLMRIADVSTRWNSTYDMLVRALNV